MKQNKIRYIKILLIALVTMVISGIVTDRFLLNEGNGIKSIEAFKDTFRVKDKIAISLMDEVARKLDSVAGGQENSVFKKLAYLNNLFEKEEISVLVFDKKQPLFWTDNTGCFLNEIHNLQEEGVVQLPNGWYYHQRKEQKDYSIHSLILIKYNYKIKNDYLHNRFADSFYFPRRFDIVNAPGTDSYQVLNSKDHYAFSVKPSGTIPCKHSLLLIPGAIYLVAFILLLILLYMINVYFMYRRSVLKTVLLLVFLIGLYTLVNRLRIPGSVFLTTLFSPQDFAFTSYWSSLGELMIFSSLFLFWAITFNRTFELSGRYRKDKVNRIITLGIFMLLSALYFVFIRYLIYNLIINSSINFTLFRVSEITISTLYGYIVIGFLLLSYLFFTEKIFLLYRKQTTIKEYGILLLFVYGVLSPIFLIADKTGSLRLNFFYVLLGSVPFLSMRKGVLSNRMTVMIVYVVVFTFYSLFTLTPIIGLHENKVLESMALNLSAEHDPTAELLLADIDDKLEGDSALHNLAFKNEDLVEDYLGKKYFNSYFREYDLQVTLCRDNDSLLVKPDNVSHSCVPFFKKMFEDNGIPIQGTHFYYIENTTGRITYVGHFECSDSEWHPSNIFIELDSKLLSEGFGFPELLLPVNSVESRLKNNFSFAKYYNGELVDRGGRYNYSLSSSDYNLRRNDNLFFMKWKGFEHCIYNYSNNGYVIVSRQLPRFKDHLTSFPYIFVFFFLLIVMLNFILHPSFDLLKRGNSLRSRIQFSIIGIVFVVLLVVGSGTVYYIMLSYKRTYQKELIDKLNSVSTEMDPVIKKANFPDRVHIDYLDYELTRISDIFQTDINLYDLNGILVSTSRPEIYEKGLISDIMNNHAYHELSSYHPTTFLQEEKIGDMNYLSAYIPVINERGEKTGYLNVPYFAREKAFRQEVTTFILAFINIYVFLFLTSILLAYFISSRITLPLRLIREHLQGVQFGKNPTPIHYHSEDELGLLVADYNRKIEELAESAELLARTERESAWREMARQIAHEIKNPLTPMKLNIQFLQRTDPSTVDNYKDMLDRVSHAIIEQIDNLSAIATEFSNFAKIPRAHNEQFNLTNRLTEIISLFDYTGECELEVRFNGNQDIMVYADKEQFSRAILNLVKNSIQAIPENRQGKIIVEVKKESMMALISVTDNGKGIAEEFHDKIFVPNFTTKSSGTGLGLAITKGIVDNFGGEIWFDSQVGKGTTFFIRMPMIK